MSMLAVRQLDCRRWPNTQSCWRNRMACQSSGLGSRGALACPKVGVIAGLVVAVAVLAAVLVQHLSLTVGRPHPGLTFTNFNRIELGMTRDEVDRILGSRGGEVSTADRLHYKRPVGLLQYAARVALGSRHSSTVKDKHGNTKTRKADLRFPESQNKGNHEETMSAGRS